MALRTKVQRTSFSFVEEQGKKNELVGYLSRFINSSHYSIHTAMRILKILKYHIILVLLIAYFSCGPICLGVGRAVVFFPWIKLGNRQRLFRTVISMIRKQWLLDSPFFASKLNAQTCPALHFSSLNL